MHLATFDTLAVTKRLKSKGFTQTQAEAITEEIQGVQDNSLEYLATKSDIRDVRSEIKAVEIRLENRMSEFEIRIGVILKDMQLRMGVLIVGLGAFLSAIKFFG